MRAHVKFIPAGLLLSMACSDSPRPPAADSTAAVQPALDQQAMVSDTKPTPRLVSVSRCLKFRVPKDCPPLTSDECLALVRTQPETRIRVPPSPALSRGIPSEPGCGPDREEFRLILKPCPAAIKAQLPDTKPTPAPR